MVKWSIPAIPALIILMVLWFTLVGFMSGFSGRLHH